MNDLPPMQNRRVLVIDDNDAIHEDFRKVLTGSVRTEDEESLDALEAAILGTAGHSTAPTFEIADASQGEQGVAMAAQAVAEGRPFAMAFVDMRMPPGW